MPLNRFITFVKPYLNLIAGAIVAYIVAKANVLGIPGLGDHGSELQTSIAAALAWGLTQLVTQLGDQKWLKGHHLSLMGDAEVQAAAFNAPQVMPASQPYDPEVAALMAEGEDLPDDDEEFASPYDVPQLNGRVDPVPAL